jgi:redox-sensitive bicupin YhaK (pirin superfamily)
MLLKSISPHVSSIGPAMEVSRYLPSAAQRQVGPFVFLDHMGPVEFPAGSGMDVRPHPHIGLATCTYLFEGCIEHRDSLGVVQEIRPGAINWMTAGRGIVHSERSPAALRRASQRVHGLQFWIALPEHLAEIEPRFEHQPLEAMPSLERPGVQLRVLAGSAYGLSAPVRVDSPLFLADIQLAAGAQLELPACAGANEEIALFVVDGELGFADAPESALAPGRLAVLAPQPATLLARRASHCVLLGGEPLGPRHVWWNFVASGRERIEQAKADWAAGRFSMVPGETEFIPLPER